MTERTPELVRITVNAPLNKVWTYWTESEHIMKWNHASEDWHCPAAENDLREGGRFNYRMEAVDGSDGFDFTGVYDAVEEQSVIAYTMADEREVRVVFTDTEGRTHIEQTFEPESEYPIDMQRQGWQSIMQNFKEYVEQAE